MITKPNLLSGHRFLYAVLEGFLMQEKDILNRIKNIKDYSIPSNCLTSLLIVLSRLSTSCKMKIE
jgi:hypothetical protein